MKNNKHTLRFRIKKAAAVGAVMLGLLGSTVTSYAAAAEGIWKQDTNGWWFQFTDGSYAQKSWLSVGANWYVFDEDGYMITGWCQIDGEWYYFKSDGSMHTGWLKDNDGVWYYLGDSGAMYTGWLNLSDKWYYLHSNGVMAADTWIDGCYLDASGMWVEGAEPQEDLTEKIVAAIDRMRTKYPDSTYWNHMGNDAAADYSNIVTNMPCNHALYGLTYCNSYILGNVRGYQCDGFARKMSDEVFGNTAGRTDYAYDFNKVKIGDYLRYSNSRDSFISNGHSVFVIGKTADSLIVVEANYGGSCMIHWDGVLTREYLDSVYAECFTRY